MMTEKEEIIELYDLLKKRVTRGSRSVIFSQASEMIYQIELLVSYGFPPESIVEFIREYRTILYDEDGEEEY
jgi:hypothetical protein